MADYLVDTNHLSAALKRKSLLRQRFDRAHSAGHRLTTIVPVLCELETGLLQTKNVVDNRNSLRQLLHVVRTWPLDRALATEYGLVHQELRRAGVVLSQVDMMLASLARMKRLTILTTDRDFERVGGVNAENWLATKLP